jgi:predicted flap endonuclease-1-like 5' DNA nuclease/predicted  nucleic acid-binding Zn-ribbon protein
MENFFAAFSHQDSIAFLISVLFAFLIGFVTAWIMWGGRAARYRREADKWKKSYEDLQAELASLREQIDLKEADVVKARREAEDARVFAAAIETEKTKWRSDLDAALEESVKAQANARSYALTIEDLNEQVLALKARVAQLSHEAEKEAESTTQVAHIQTAFDATVSRINNLEEKIGHLAAENESLKASAQAAGRYEEVKQSYDAAAARLAALEERLGSLASENEGLKSELEGLKTTSVPFGVAATSSFQLVEDENGVTSHDGNHVEAAKAEILAANGDKWPAASETDKDDLTMIKGIGSFLEKKLNELGIYKFEQLMHFTDFWTDKLTTAIEFFPGRIERDDWVGQAARLYEIKKDNPEALDPAAIFSKKPTDLKVVEGIGPKIEKLLKKAGIKTLEELAETNADRLKEILDQAGDAYRVHDPSTWPIQARLAAKGDWEKLKVYQDVLVGGREK